jgi:hypothetical protein
MSNSHAVGDDGLNPLLIKQNIDPLAVPLAYIFNLSFSSGIFPKLLKSAIVTPIYKSGVMTEPGNYRPISILTFFSKLLEKLYFNRLTSFVNAHNVLHPHQFGFRANYSTSLALAHVVSSLLTKVKSTKSTVLCLLDLKKAFDLVNHNLLLTKLSKYGIRGLPLQWLGSYLDNRSQRTRVNNILSDARPISAGVPQGSILGPLLFILFINDVFQFNSINAEIYLYADDTAIIFSADSDIMLQVVIDNFFKNYCLWCDNNCIILNPSKSNFMSFNNVNVALSVNNHLLTKLDAVKYLGVYLDNKLSWNHHVDYVLKMCCQRIGMFKKIMSYLPKFVIVMYYNAFIKSCFSYGALFWYNNDRSGRCKLDRKIENLISFLAKYSRCNVTDFIRNNHIVTVDKAYKMSCISFMFDLCNNRLPSQLAYFPLVVNNVLHEHNTRTAINIHINSVSAVDRRNFIYHCILLWNNCHIEKHLSKRAFLCAYKTELLSI